MANQGHVAGQASAKPTLAEIVAAAKQLTTKDRDELSRIMSVTGKKRYVIYGTRSGPVAFEVMATDENDAQSRLDTHEAEEVFSGEMEAKVEVNHIEQADCPDK